VDGFQGVDSSVVFFHGRWWLFTSDRSKAVSWQLHLYYADRLEGPWIPHPLNPVKTDVRSSRSAGTPFIKDETLFRPAQDCSRGYGRQVVVNRVKTITPTDFEEITEAVIGPDRRSAFPDGIHHLAAVGALTLVDGRRDVFDLLKQPRKRLRNYWGLMPWMKCSSTVYPSPKFEPFGLSVLPTPNTPPQYASHPSGKPLLFPSVQGVPAVNVGQPPTSF